MTIVVLMGVTGSGKTTVGQMLAQRFGWSFLDADDFHPEANIAKMRAGVALGDADRWPWLDALNARLRQCRAAGANAVLACSALKRVYRERIAAGLPDTHWVHLAGSFEQIGTDIRRNPQPAGGRLLCADHRVRHARGGTGTRREGARRASCPRHPVGALGRRSL